MCTAPKTCSLDPIPTPLLLEILDCLLPSLTALINSSLSSGLFPQVFKSAVIFPLLKKPSLDPNELKNFRPISNLPFISKIIEKLVLVQISHHLSANNLLNQFQSAYRPGHSTETALLKIANDLLLSLDDGKIYLLASLDLSAAFDTIDHNILLHRLQHDFGLSGTVLDWFSSYLSGRIQSVYVHSHTSVPVSVSCGVPRGSVLGPILFELYTTPLSAVIERHSILHHSYADDSQLQNSATPDRLPMWLCIDDIKDWMTDNKLKLNDDKTEVMIISSSRMSTALSIPESFDIGNASVPFSDTVKNLGVTLDCHLSLKTHVLNVVRTANFELRRISSIRRLLTTEATATLVSAFILSRLDYCNSLLSGCPRSLILRLQKVQNNAARLILGISKREHISPHLASLHWLPIDSRVKYKLACICYNWVSTNSPPYLSDLLTVYTAARQLRSNSDNFVLRRPSVRTVCHYPMVKGLSHIPPLLLGTLFLSRSALLIMSLLSDPELKHTFSVLPTNCLNVSVVNVICFPQSFISCCTAGWVGEMFCQCSVTFATMFCNNVSVIYTIICLKSVWGRSQTAGRNSCSIASRDVSNWSYPTEVLPLIDWARFPIICLDKFQ